MNHKAIGLVLIVHVSAAISGLAFQNQTPAFTWQAGTQGFNEYGVYETKGLPSATANPGARAAAASWTDAAGNFWLYGGGRSKDFIGGYDLMDDLWRYSPETGKWTWVSGSSVVNQPPVYGSRGSAASLNSPGARWLSMYWTDASGNFWLFGGGIHGTGEANDLWKYDIQSGEWTWVSGSSVNPVAGNYGVQGLGSSSTSPGSRGIGATWTDQSGNLWLFGGNGYDSEGKFGPLNDLWKFSIGTGIWTWVGGSDKISAQPVYGTLGSASPSNNPGARWGTVTWQDPSGAFWLFGGSGYFGDLWKYDLVTGLWTYMSGNSTPNEFGVYGAVGVSSPENRPGARAFSIGWSDEFGDLWMFGGDGYDANGNSGLLSDLWKFDTSAEAWTWMGGSTERNQRGNYGMIGQADGTNMPGSRRAAVSWRAATGELWFFGGEAADLQGNWAARDDLWKISMQRDSSVPDYLPTDGLLGWWPFNGNAQDESGNEYHGMADGVTLTKDRFDQPGRAFAFDGIDDYIDLYSVKNLLSAINGLEKFTLSYWAYTYPNSTGSIWGHWSSNGGVVGYNGGMVSGFRPVDGWGFYAGNYAGCCAFIQSSFNNFGKWVHVAMVYDATKSNNADVLKMYYNGQPFESLPGTISNTPIGYGTSVFLGRRNIDQDRFGDYFLGNLDDVAIWTRDLTATEVQSIYTGQNLPRISLTLQSNTLTYGDPPIPYDLIASPGLTVEISSSDTSVVKTDNGLIIIRGAGKALITAVTADAKLSASVEITVAKANLTATALDQNRSYGEANPTLNFQYSGFRNNENASVIDSEPAATTTTTLLSTAGAYPITLGGGLDNNYNFNYTQGTLTIDKAILTVTAENKSRTYGTPNPALTTVYSGFRNNESAAVIDSEPAATTAAILTSDAGSYPIIPGGGTDNNYTFIYSPGILTVTKAPQTITFPPLTEVSQLAGTLNLSASASSGLAVTFASSDPSRISISGNSAVVNGPGPVTITASQYGNGNYEAAPAVTRTFCVLPVTPVITITQGSGLTLNSSATGGNQWYRNGQALPGATGTTLQVNESALYAVKTTVEGCSSLLSETVNLIITGDLGLNSNEVAGLELFPNPVSAELHYRLAGIFSIGSTVRLLNESGKVLEVQFGQTEGIIDVQNLPAGIYLVQVRKGREYVTRKVTKF